MNRKILLVGLAPLPLIAGVAVAIFLFSGPSGFRGTTYLKLYPVAKEIELTRGN